MELNTFPIYRFYPNDNQKFLTYSDHCIIRFVYQIQLITLQVILEFNTFHSISHRAITRNKLKFRRSTQRQNESRETFHDTRKKWKVLAFWFVHI